LNTISPERSRTVTGVVTSFTRTRIDGFCMPAGGSSGFIPAPGVIGPGGAPCASVVGAYPSKVASTAAASTQLAQHASRPDRAAHASLANTPPPPQ